MRWVSGVCVVAAVLAMAAEARAHGCYPEANQLAFDPDTGELTLVRITNVLIVRTEDDEWRWQCTEALDWRGGRQQCNTSVSWMGDGSLLSEGILSGVIRSPDASCEWHFENVEPELENGRMVVIDHAVHPDDPSTVLAASSRGGAPNRVYRSTDDGVTWEPTSDYIDEILFESIAMAPTDPDRVYLTGAIPPNPMEGIERQAFVFRSTDGGATWEEPIPFELQDRERNIYLLDVDPQDPDHLFMYTEPETEELVYQAPFRIVRSTDGGQSWEDVDVEVPLLGGLTFSPDGERVWIGVGDQDREAGALWRSEDGGESFEQVPELEYLVGCVHHHEGALWICANHWRDGFVVGRSNDDGDTFEPVMDFDDVGDMFDCPEGSHGAEACEPWRCDINNELFGGEPEIGQDGELEIADECLPDTGDAGVGGPGDDDDGCGCAVVGTRGGAAPWLVSAALLLMLLRLRPRAASPARRSRRWRDTL